jgi:hypothetical protein
MTMQLLILDPQSFNFSDTLSGTASGAAAVP